MQSVLQWAASLRVLLTPLLWLTRHSLLYTVLLLTFLDVIDCNPIVLSQFPRGVPRQCSLDRQYELVDKLIDWGQNAVALILLQPSTPLSPYVVRMAWFFMLYRAFGVLAYVMTGQDTMYIWFVEFIKEYLLLVWWYQGPPTTTALLVVLVGKVIYEYLMHGEHVMLKLYRLIFEI
jgi:hypothetical protein